MAITSAEAKAWMTIYMESFINTPAPYYGVNTFDVRKENWDAMVKNARGQNECVEAVGGKLYLWAVTDMGAVNRVVWINYYPKNLAETAPSLSEEQQQRVNALTDEAMQLYDQYNWFIARELPGGPLSIS